MKRVAVLAALAACSTEASFRPVMPMPVLDLPEGVRHTLGDPSWVSSALVATDATVLVQHASGLVSELSIEGAVLPAPAIPPDAQVLCAAGDWVGWWSARGIGRRTPAGAIEEHSFASPQPSYLGIVADARGIYWLQRRLGVLELWGWTSGPPARIVVPIAATFELVAVDASHVYGSEHLEDGMGGAPFLVRYAIADGARELLVERYRYDYQSLQPFVVRGDRLLYQRGADVFVHSLAAGSEEKLGTIPSDRDYQYYGAIALDDRYAWFGKYRLSNSGARHHLGAPPGHHVSDLAVLGERIAWLTEQSGDSVLGGQPSQLYVVDVDEMLESD